MDLVLVKVLIKQIYQVYQVVAHQEAVLVVEEVEQQLVDVFNLNRSIAQKTARMSVFLCYAISIWILY